MNAFLSWTNISIPHTWLSVGESNQLPQENHTQIWFIYVGVQCKAIKALTTLNNYASGYIYLPNIYKIIVCYTQNKENEVSSSRKVGAKMERDVGSLTSNCLIAGLKRTPKDPQPEIRNLGPD